MPEQHHSTGHEGHDHHDHGAGGHGHHDHSGHSHAPANFGRAFLIGIAVNLAYIVAESWYGVASHSLALLADAGHNLGDVLGLAAAWAASILSQRRPSDRYTYGLRRSSIFAALGNAITLLVVTGGIAWEALRRLAEPQSAAGLTIVIVAAVGILVNGGTALLFMSGRKGDMNIRAAYMHMAADALVASGVVVSGAIILFTGWSWLDPVVSLVVSGIIVMGTWSLLRESLALSLDAVPPGIDRHAVEAYLAALPGVTEVHDLHIWGMSTTETALTAHIIRPGASPDDDFLHRVARDLKSRHRIDHPTIQVETGGGEDCHLAPSTVV